MVCCCVACYNVRTPGDKSFSFHRFPHYRPDLLEKWIQAMRRENWRPTLNNRLCSAHFTEDCFLTRVAAERRNLKDDAVPSLFDYGFYYYENNKPVKKKKCDIEKKKKELKKFVRLIPAQPDPVERKIKEMLNFIEAYKKYPVLWRAGDKTYRSREMKRDALQDLGKKYGLSPEIVLTKIKNLRSYFHREHSKVLKSKSGSSPQDTYESSWFGYKALLFILDGDYYAVEDSMTSFDESLVLKQRESLNCDSQNQRLPEKSQQTSLSSLNCDSQTQRLHERNQQTPLSSLNCDSQNQRLHGRDQQIPSLYLDCDSQNQKLLEKDQQIPLLYLDCDSQNQKLHERDQQTPSLNCDFFCKKESISLSYSNQSRKTYSRYRGNNYHPWTDHNYFQNHKNDMVLKQRKSLDYNDVTSQNQRRLEKKQQSSSSSLNFKISRNKEESYSHCKENNRQWTNHIYFGKDSQHDDVFAATLTESEAVMDMIESEVMDVKPDNIPDPIACATEYNSYPSIFADEDLQDPLACDVTDLEVKQEIKEEPPDDDIQITEGVSVDMFATELDKEVIQFRSLSTTDVSRNPGVINGAGVAIKPEVFDDAEFSRIQGIFNGGRFTVKSEVFDCTGFARNSGVISDAVAVSPGVIDDTEVASSLWCRSC